MPCCSYGTACRPPSARTSPITTPQLDPVVTDDPRYELRLRVLQELAPKDPNALAIQYTRDDDLTDEERVAVEQLGRKGNVIIKERLPNVAGADELSPKQVVAAVQARVPYRFTTDDFQRAWKTLNVRPPTKGGAPGVHRREVLHLLPEAPGLRLPPGVRGQARARVLYDC